MRLRSPQFASAANTEKCNLIFIDFSYVYLLWDNAPEDLSSTQTLWLKEISPCHLFLSFLEKVSL